MKKNSQIYIELLKTTCQTVNNKKVLNDCFLTWGNHDFIKIIKNETDLKEVSEEQEPILWFKSTYEESHSSFYDGIEHQPLFLSTSFGLNNDIVSNLYDCDKKHIFLLTLFQMDYFCNKEISCSHKTISSMTQDELLGEISKFIEDQYCNNSKKYLTAQVFLDWGEADIAVLFESDSVQYVSDVISSIRCCFPVVRNYSLIIFPYTYKELVQWGDDVDFTTQIQCNISSWFSGTNQPIDILIQYMTDTSHQEILTKTNNGIKLILGDYDVYNITSANKFTIEPYNPTNPNSLYRYSKTTPLIPINNNMQQPFSSETTNEYCQYNKLIYLLDKSFNDIIQVIKNDISDTFKSVYIENFTSAKRTLINLANYFARLHETKHTPDVYIHLKPIFIELRMALKSLKQCCDKLTDDNYSKDIIEQFFLVFDVDIKYLMSKMQQFLGIVSLSPRAFSEAHGSYMRSANAALKLICAYHSSVYFMHEASKQRIDGSRYIVENQCAPEYAKFEHENCAVLVLPSRDAETINATLFTSITPAHHMCVIEANFKSLFRVREMLFLLAHEVGHFSGNRMRNERQGLFIKSSVRYMVFNEIFFDLLLKPYAKFMSEFYQLDGDEGFINEGSIVTELDDRIDYKKEYKNRGKLIENINILSNEISKNIIYQIEKHQNDISLEENLNLCLKLKYLKPSMELASNVFFKNLNDVINSDSFKTKLKSLAETIFQVTHDFADQISCNSNIPVSIKRKVIARMMYENFSERHYKVYMDYFSCLSTNRFEYYMDLMSIMIEDIFSDIYAIKMLEVDCDDYLKYIFNNRLDKNSYTDCFFISRVIIILKSIYCVTNKNKLMEKLFESIPSEWKEEISPLIYLVLNNQDFYLKCGLDYANKVKKVLRFNQYTKGYEGVSLIRNFYRDSGNNFYDLWKKGLDRTEVTYD